jgi:hypothetical protein
MRQSGVETLPKQTACQRSLQSFSEGTRQENSMIHYFEAVLIFTALMFFPIYIYWIWEVTVSIRKLFS